MKDYIDKIWHFWRRSEHFFKCYVSLKAHDDDEDYERRKWSNRLTSPEMRLMKKIYDFGIQTNKAKYYRLPVGVIEYIRNCFQHAEVSMLQMEYHLQEIFPEVLGKIHYEIYSSWPRTILQLPDGGDFDLYHELLAGPTTYYFNKYEEDSGLMATLLSSPSTLSISAYRLLYG
ncbi:hypothetical protein COLO4_31612 [Corchorus olitorius]|uniref:Uncharacterized protein n=1 Tax=Corchorus olitorius TaxID=93759 RepID=A0A1R3H3S8_9ROSI|nr:hypothetical protein COLO4_31612 [Corchorus olitorius]